MKLSISGNLMGDRGRLPGTTCISESLNQL